jgi:hypothetical protein
MRTFHSYLHAFLFKGIGKVLKHYSREPADNLKLRAAEFLIVNNIA